MSHILTDHELATVIVALRNWQVDALNEDMHEQFLDHFDEYVPLDNDEIDALIESLNS